MSRFSEERLWQHFFEPYTIGKHLLTIYSIAVGLNADKVVDIGIGSTTGTLRMAVAQTGGCVYSCDRDGTRFSSLTAEQDEQWKLSLESSDGFLRTLEPPIDFAVHDGAHDYYTVKQDLTLLLPKMRTYGIICVHDTQQPTLGQEMLAAIRDATAPWSVSLTNLPFSGGLAIIRIERGAYPSGQMADTTLADGSSDTRPIAFPMRPDETASFPDVDGLFARAALWARWKARKYLRRTF